MSEYGALPTGFRRKRLDEIFSELCEYFKGTIGVDPSEHPQSFFAVIVQSFADQQEQLWEEVENVYYQLYPGSADGVNLDNDIQISGFMPSCSVGSVAILRSNTPKMWMKSTTTWVLQTQPEAKGVNEDGS